MILKLVFMLTFFKITCLTQSHFPEIPCGSVYKPKNCEHASSSTLNTVEDFERCAPAKLEIRVRDYIWRGTGREITLRENQEAFQRIRIRKRVMRNTWNHTLETTILGRKIPFPIAISPTAAQLFCHRDGEKATAKATDLGTIMVLSCFAGTSLEQVAASVPHDTNLWMQMYLFRNRTDNVILVRRAEKSGYKALVVTVDNSANSIPKCHAYHSFKEFTGGLPNLPNSVWDSVDSNVTLADISWLKGITKLPILVKGILTGEDAVSAVKAGASAIFVSNHGGRQLDGSLPTIDALAEVVDTLKVIYPDIEVYVDSGVRNGFDVFKALARGARAVFIGRPVLWGLTMGGEAGVKKVFNILKNELREAMIHAGFSQPSQITRDSVIPPFPNFHCNNNFPPLYSGFYYTIHLCCILCTIFCIFYFKY